MSDSVKRFATSEKEVEQVAKAVATANLAEPDLKADKRTQYYDKWDQLAKETVQAVEKEDMAETEAANRSLGLDPSAPKSEAEKKDKEKREMLKEAKKRWEEKKLKEEMLKHSIEELHDQEIVLSSEYVQFKPVLLVKSSKRSKFRLPDRIKHRVVKLSIHDCEDCIFEFESETITQHTEFAHCKNISVHVRAPLATLQLDLCEEVKVKYARSVFTHETKIFHAGVRRMAVETDDGHSHSADYLEDGAVAIGESTPEEQQFVTKLIKDKSKLHTEKVLRTRGDLPTTESEIKEAEGTEDEVLVKPQTRARQAELKKIAGNEAFADGEYAQAAVFYTEALTLAVDTSSELIPVCYSNRAFCFLKLGQHEKAEQDARKCIELDPNYVKGHFRLGLALHARGRYFEALPVLAKALELEPKNEAIKQAIGFAEMKARKLQQY